MFPNSARLSAQGVSEAFVESKLQFMTDVHIWPERQILDPHAWLRNFRQVERPYALNLLNVFLYYNELFVDALFRSAVQSLSAAITASATSLAEAKGRWRDFLATVRVTYVEGERPRPTDSGLLFARKARQVLEIDESQIVEPATALAELLVKPTYPVLLVDDFVGGGNQMTATWFRQYQLGSGRTGTFASASQNGATIIYAPLMAASYGLRTLAAKCPGLTVKPAHTLDSGYSLTDPDSILWPDALKSSSGDFLYEASRRAGIVAGYEYGWKGFHELSLAIAFWHSVPDATLPLFFWDQDGWAPLIRRT
jgi:hypothetical protein